MIGESATADTPVRPRPPDDASLRRELLAACRILDGERLTDAFGHVSARAQNGTVLITPRVGPGLVERAEELLRLDLDGTVLDGDPALIPGEAALHLGVLRARPDLGSVVRFHGPDCFAWSTLVRPLPATTGLALMLGAQVPVHDVAVTVTRPEQADALAETLGRGTAVLLRGFGAVTAGESVADAVVRATFLERAASAVLRASVVGMPEAYDDAAADAFAARRPVIAEQVARAWTYLQERWPA
ncbi:MAG: class II aldolase/adducin family protein [Solirubrobacteraceae bacterium]